MYVQNIRYGSKLVKKFYIGEKLIWECLDAQGGMAESKSYAVSADVVVPVLYPIVAMTESASYTNSELNVLELTLMMGENESATYGDGTVELLQVLLLTGAAKNETEANAYCETIKAILASSLSKSELDTIATGNIFDLIQMESNEMSSSDTFAKITRNICMLLHTDTTSNFNATAISEAITPIKVKSSVESHNFSNSILNSWIVLKMSTSVPSISYIKAIADSADVVLVNGNSYSITDGEAIGRFFDLLSMQGDNKTESYGDATIFINVPVLIEGKGTAISRGEGVPFILDAILGDSNEVSRLNTDSELILWYPPIGDGEILFERDGVDITKDGDILEIRQAYRVNINEEKGILEVI